MPEQSTVAPIVFVHGGAHGAWCWKPLLPFLDGDALAIDLPPKSVRGGSRRLEPVPELRTLTVGDFADSVLRDVDTAGIERFVLVGHSMGGLTISQVAGRVPDRIEHLVYVSCMVPPEGASAIEALPEDLRDMTRDAVEEARRGGVNPIGGLDEDTTRSMFCNNITEGFVTCRDARKWRLTCAYSVGWCWLALAVYGRLADYPRTNRRAPAPLAPSPGRTDPTARR
jgi:pimeloyl-ACP methyl ester carboxylesterase